MTILTATLEGGKTIRYHSKMIGQGTMKDVYFTEDGASVVCFYQNREFGKDLKRRRRLREILAGYNLTLVQPHGRAADQATADYYRKLYCWPTAIVEQPYFGFIAPRYPDNFFFKTGTPDIKGREKNGARFLLSKARQRLQEKAPTELGTWLQALLICAGMARGVNRMHMAGLAHSDLSPNNVLVDPTSGRCIIIDIDSFVVPNLHAPDVIGTPGYIAPEVLQTAHLPVGNPQRKHPDITTDQHALAVLIYQYLLLRHPLQSGRWIPPGASGEEQDAKKLGIDAIYCEHPTNLKNRLSDGDYIPASACGKKLSALFNRAFVEGIRDPKRRPSATEWLSALVKTLGQITYCGSSKCQQRWFVVEQDAPEPVRCPFCRTPLGFSFPILNLTRPNQTQSDGHLVAYQGMNLMHWHVYVNKFPGPETSNDPLAQVQFATDRNQWILKNVDLPGLRSTSGQVVPKGSQVALTPGTKLILADPPHGRIVEVVYKNGSATTH